MTIWCPECGSFHFNLVPLATEVIPAEKTVTNQPMFIFKDTMTCKTCTFQFVIDWQDEERKWWMMNNTRTERPNFKKTYGKPYIKTTTNKTAYANKPVTN